MGRGRIDGTVSWYVHGFAVYRVHAKTATTKIPTSEMTPAPHNVNFQGRKSMILISG